MANTNANIGIFLTSSTEAMQCLHKKPAKTKYGIRPARKCDFVAVLTLKVPTIDTRVSKAVGAVVGSSTFRNDTSSRM